MESGRVGPWTACPLHGQTRRIVSLVEGSALGLLPTAGAIGATLVFREAEAHEIGGGGRGYYALVPAGSVYEDEELPKQLGGTLG